MYIKLTYKIKIKMRTQLSIRHWRFKEIKDVIKQVKDNLTCLTFIPHKDGYLRLHISKHRNLFRLLGLLGFFDFHSTNNGYTCYLHQIVLYCKAGWKLYREGKFCEQGKLEVHHLNSKVTDSFDANNLVYVTPYENKYMAQVIKAKRLLKCLVIGFTSSWVFKQTISKTFSRLGFESFT